MKIIFLGTNGWYDTPTGNTPSILIETHDEHIVLDAGFGFYKARHLADHDKPMRIFISHLHLDHLIGLHTLPLFKMSKGIDIYVPKLMEKDLRSLLRRPFTSAPLLLPTKVRFHALSSSTRLPFELEMKALRHSVPCFGYRFTVNGKTVTYCTDTGICRNLTSLSRGADLLITECAMAPGDRSPNLFHLTPETAARVARDAGARHLALCHFDPGKYPSIRHRAAAEHAAKKIFVATVAAEDGTVIVV